jgi:hypothetical protein
MNVTLVATEPGGGVVGTGRYLLLRGEDGDRLVARSRLPAEANLHDALAMNPQLLPLADLGLGRSVVVGREASLASGYADLVLLDESGQLCLVEVKKKGNPDTREVIAQLLDYAANLWGKTVGEFWATVVSPYLRTLGQYPPPSLAEFVAASFPPAAETGPNEGVDRLIHNLESTLQQGTFVLVVAAEQIPAGVERALQYLNGQGMRMYALEVDYFADQIECFVPRLAVTPPPTKPPRPPAIDRATFLTSLDSPVAAIAARALDTAEEIGARIGWNSQGATINLDYGQSRQLGTFERTAVSITLKPPAGFPPEPFHQTRTQIERLGLGEPRYDGDWQRLAYRDASPEQLQRFADVLIDLCRTIRNLGPPSR